jgi:hypothetical protein
MFKLGSRSIAVTLPDDWILVFKPARENVYPWVRMIVILVQFQKLIMLAGMWVVKMALMRVHGGEDSMRNWSSASQFYIMGKKIHILSMP